MNEAHAGSAQDGTLPFGGGYRSLNQDQLTPLINIRLVYEKCFMMKCCADIKGSLKSAGARRVA